MDCTHEYFVTNADGVPRCGICATALTDEMVADGCAVKIYDTRGITSDKIALTKPDDARIEALARELFVNTFGRQRNEYANLWYSQSDAEVCFAAARAFYAVADQERGKG